MNNLSLDQTSEIVCDACKGTSFVNAFMLRKASRILTGSQQDQLIPIQIFACVKCNHVNESFIPEPLRTTPYVEIIEEPVVNDEAKVIELKPTTSTPNVGDEEAKIIPFSK